MQEVVGLDWMESEGGKGELLECLISKLCCTIKYVDAQSLPPLCLDMPIKKRNPYVPMFLSIKLAQHRNQATRITRTNVLPRSHVGPVATCLATHGARLTNSLDALDVYASARASAWPRRSVVHQAVMVGCAVLIGVTWATVNTTGSFVRTPYVDPLLFWCRRLHLPRHVVRNTTALDPLALCEHIAG